MNRDGRGRWTPGTSGNTRGRPRRGQALAELLKAELDRAGPDGRSRGERIARKLVELAEAGSIPAIKECYDRVLGKAPQTLTYGHVFDPNDGLEGVTPEDEAEVAARIDEILGHPRVAAPARARETGEYQQ
jgi:hypothetical protein